MNGGAVRRVTVVFEGHVQGIGFRYTVRELASGRPVCGFVRNERDGGVCVVAEGPEPELQLFLEEIRQSPVGRYILRERENWSRASGEFAGFEVAYA